MIISSRIKIIIVIGQLELGGAENHLLKVLPHLDNEQFELAVFTLHPNGVLYQPMVDTGVRVIQAASPWSGLFGLLRVSVHLIKTFRKEKPDVIHFFLPQAYILGTICSLAVPSARRIMSRRSLNNYQLAHPILKYVEHYLHKYMDVVLGNSVRVVEQLKEEGIDQKKIGLIYNGIENESVATIYTRHEARRKLEIADNALIFVIVANLITYKGHDDLLTAFGLITDVLPHDWRLICVGRDDGYGDELYERSIRLGVHDHIIWIGQTLDVSIYNAAADIGILPSHEEGFSNSLLEGMVGGLPMVVTDVGGNTEAIEEDISGLVVPSHSPNALCEAILKLVSDKSLRVSVSKAAKQRVLRKFTINKCLTSYAAIYEYVFCQNRGTLPVEFKL